MNMANDATEALYAFSEFLRELAVIQFRNRLEDRFAGANALDAAVERLRALSDAPSAGETTVRLGKMSVSVPVEVAQLVSQYLLSDGVDLVEFIRANVPEETINNNLSARGLIFEALRCRVAKEIDQERRAAIDAIVDQFSKALAWYESIGRRVDSAKSLEEVAEAITFDPSKSEQAEPEVVEVRIAAFRLH